MNGQTDCKCFEDHDKLPALVTEEELNLMVSIQIVALLSCGLKFNVIRFAGDRVTSAMGMKSIGKTTNGMELYSMESKLTTFIPSSTYLLSTKHTAYYFHRYPALANVIFATIDESNIKSSAAKSNKKSKIPQKIHI